MRDSEMLLPVIVPTTKKSPTRLYHHPVCGIRIEAVEADGNVITGRPYDMVFDEFDLTTMTTSSDWHLYLLTPDSYDDPSSIDLFCVSEMAEGAHALEVFPVPIDARKIKIQYRPRYPLNTLGNLIEVTAERNELAPF